MTTLLRIASLAPLFVGSLLASDPAAAQSPDQVLAHLLEGNQRYRANHPKHPHQQSARRAEVAKAQHPPAVILSCSDSRVPPEVVFDQGLGDLFVVRVAGNVIDDDVLGSIEYAVEHAGATLIMVLGHERCGAVKAAVQGGAVEGHVGKLIEAIRPALETGRSKPGDVAENVMRANVLHSVSLINSDEPVITHAVRSGKVKVVGARYDLDTGVVEVLK